MEIKVTNFGKRYNAHWIFRKFNYQFVANRKYAITGPNGSGKSTLLQTLGSFIAHNEGDIFYSAYGNALKPENIYRYISIATPYLELIEEMTLSEFLAFHQKMKNFVSSVSQEVMIETVGLSGAAEKQIRYFSSGMKQRVKLAQAFFSDTPILLLDEPLTNLDKEGMQVYHKLINDFSKDRLLIISSNDENEYAFCDETIFLPDFK